jgi:hydroxycarboxylate dehydrogenase B
MARQHKTACVVTNRCRHVGRLGYFTQMAAEAGMFGLASANSAKAGHSVVPYGGLLGRVAPNPISYAVPGPEHPIVADMAMSTTSKGKTVVYRNRGQKLPEGWIVDAEGNPSTDPNDLFKDPKGWILPLGGNVGYKGFAFLLLAEILGGALGGHSITEDIPDGVNGVCFFVVDISAFVPVERFRELMGEMIAYEKSAPAAPGFKEVLLPGELDFRVKAERQAQGIPIDPVTWGQIREAAEALHVPVTEQT